MARCLAVAMSQAPGLSGTPDSGHCSSAATSASCASSSASADVAHDPREAGDEPGGLDPPDRVDGAMGVGSRLGSRHGSRSDHRSPAPARARRGSRHGSFAPLRMTPSSGSRPRRRADSACISVNPAAAFCTSAGKSAISCTWRTSIISLSAAGQRDAHSIGLLLRLHMDHPVAAEHFLGLGERPVGDRRLAAGERDPRALDGGCRPSSASSTPAFCSASLYFIIAATPRRPAWCPAPPSRSPWGSSAS